MRRQTAVTLYVLVMVALIVAVDVLFLRHHVAERLIVNIAIVLGFGASYWRFLGRS